MTPEKVRKATPKPDGKDGPKKGPTWLGDGNGLYLQITPPGVKSWVYRYKLHGRTRSMGLGSIHTYSLDDARKRARECRVLVDRGIDPIDARALDARQRSALAPPPAPPQPKRADHELKTFRWCADAYLLQLKDAHRNAKHSAQWRSTLEQYAYPVIGTKPVDAITSADVVEILEPLFSRIPTTAACTASQYSVNAVCAGCASKLKEPSQAWYALIQEVLPRKRRP